jgi:uncharacterized protein (TIGR03083 family)
MIDVLPLFPQLDSSLIEVLSGLSPEQWNKDTICKKWKVKDIAAHLLDSAIRRLSIGRDGYQGAAAEINNQDELLNYLNNLNADWVNAYERVIPAILISQLNTVQEELYLYFKDLDPAANAMFPVSRAGEKISDNRFDIAREFTERWLHQQQIRQAVGARSLMNRDLYNPFLEICMKALPHHFKDLSSAASKTISVEVVGDAGGLWTIVRREKQWEFITAERPADSTVYIDQNIAWMLFSGGIDIYEAGQYWQVTGDQDLGRHVLVMRSFTV